MASKISPFLDPGPTTTANSLAIIQLSRDNFEPVYLVDSKGTHDGYAEGAVVNTRFGSFPHSTMLNKPWGSQIRASNVDTGSRGKKRKRNGGGADASLEGSESGSRDVSVVPEPDAAGTSTKKAVTAASGFVHILPPTPEIWTSSLPHRTQVVYIPDYSYILHRIRARPGTRLIEAGAGSGSFTHAAARAVFNGYPESDNDKRRGKVFSFELNTERFGKMKEEIANHGLEGIVQITHRDVYNKGFLVDGRCPNVEAVFLDLPAPWEALPHLSRRRPQSDTGKSSDGDAKEEGEAEWISPLNPKRSVYLCTFSPCIEQVTRTVSTLRHLGWRDIEMVEIAHRKIQVYRERIGMDYYDERGVNLVPKDVNEALAKLRQIEVKNSINRASVNASRAGHVVENDGRDDDDDATTGLLNGDIAGPPASTKTWMQGRLETRSEAELKTHTSYLVFAILPREWTEEDEAAAAAKWPCGGEKTVVGGLDKYSRKQAKREMLAGKGKSIEGASRW